MFFVFGSPRSGTTLLAQCLNAHSAVVVPNETDFIVPLAFIFNRISDAEKGRQLVWELISTSKMSNSLLEFFSPEALRDLIFSTEYHPGKIIDSIYDKIAKAEKKKLAGDKSPNDLSDVPALQLAGIIPPERKIVHIVRDVRDMMASLYRLKWIGENNVLYSQIWNNTNLYLHLNRRQSSRYLLIRYEDLTRQPRAILTRVCHFLGVEFEEGMLAPEKRHPRYKESGYQSFHGNLLKPISAARIGVYRHELTRQQLAACEDYAHEALAIFGYRQPRFLERMVRNRLPGLSRRDSRSSQLAVIPSAASA